jgi:hypothetical protein
LFLNIVDGSLREADRAIKHLKLKEIQIAGSIKGKTLPEFPEGIPPSWDG